MSLSFDPYSVIKDFLSKKKEQKELDAMVNRFYKVRSNGTTTLGILSKFNHVGKSLLLVLETRNGDVSVAFESVETIQEVPQKQRLDELIAISKSRDQVRSTHLSWITDSAKPVRDGSQKWFNDEVNRARHQIHILTNLFPHRSYQNLGIELDGIARDFDASVSMLNDVLALVEARKVTEVKEIYHDYGKASPQADQGEEPDVISSLVGMFAAARNLDDLVQRIDRTVDSITDMVSITKMVQEAD